MAPRAEHPEAARGVGRLTVIMRVPTALSASVPVILMTALLFAGCRSKRTPAHEPTAPIASHTREALRAAPTDADAPAHAHGMWVWSTRKRLDEPSATASLLETTRQAHLTEVYLSVNGGVLDDARLVTLVSALVEAGVRVEALAGEAQWYEPEKRAEVIALVDSVGAFNTRNAQTKARFAAVHLDIEPHQLPENRGKHPFLPALAATIAAARDRALTYGMSTSADLPRFAFDEEGALFANAAQRPFVMLYQLRERSPEWLVKQSGSVLRHAYESIPAESAGRLVIGLRVEDYPTNIDAMAGSLDTAYEAKDPRFGGWAIHDEAKYRARPQ